MNLTNYYNVNVLGYYPGEENTAKTACTIEYLKDNKIDDETILNILNHIESADAFTPDMIPEETWENSLLRKDGFYLHQELKVTSPAPVIDTKTGEEIKTELYNEMKIIYTVEDLLSYYYKKLSIAPEFRQRKRDIAQFNNLLSRYSSFNNVDGVEIILDVIDQAAYKHQRVLNPFDLDDAHKIYSASEALRKAKLRPEAGIIWRGALRQK